MDVGYFFRYPVILQCMQNANTVSSFKAAVRPFSHSLSISHHLFQHLNTSCYLSLMVYSHYMGTAQVLAEGPNGKFNTMYKCRDRVIFTQSSLICCF